jgi:hypothetical protein
MEIEKVENTKGLYDKKLNTYHHQSARINTLTSNVKYTILHFCLIKLRYYLVYEIQNTYSPKHKIQLNF